MGESTAAPKYAGDKKVLKAKFAHTEEEAPLNFFPSKPSPLLLHTACMREQTHAGLIQLRISVWTVEHTVREKGIYIHTSCIEGPLLFFRAKAAQQSVRCALLLLWKAPRYT